MRRGDRRQTGADRRDACSDGEVHAPPIPPCRPIWHILVRTRADTSTCRYGGLPGRRANRSKRTAVDRETRVGKRKWRKRRRKARGERKCGREKKRGRERRSLRRATVEGTAATAPTVHGLLQIRSTAGGAVIERSVEHHHSPIGSRLRRVGAWILCLDRRVDFACLPDRRQETTAFCAAVGRRHDDRPPGMPATGTCSTAVRRSPDRRGSPRRCMGFAYHTPVHNNSALNAQTTPLHDR